VAVVFINYRVREQSGYAALLYRELAVRLGADRVFFASRSIRLGDDFVDRIFDTLSRCTVLLAIIGPRWLDYLGDPDQDWVRREIRAAFAHGLRVIPILVDDAQLPDAALLPEDIAALGRCQSLRLRHYSFERDLAQLVAELRRAAPQLDDAPAGPPAATPAEFRLAGDPAPGCRLVIVPGTIRRIRTADIWVNSENTDMHMARHNEFSVSGIIRYWGAVRDDTGRVVDDVIADELEARVGSQRPVAPGAAIVTGAGALRASHHVHHIIHVAAVQGEPGAGYRQVRNIGWCVTNALGQAERLAADLPARAVLFPLLGTGVAGAEVIPTVEAMVTGAVDYLTEHPDTRLCRILFLGYNSREYQAIDEVLRSTPAVVPEALD
jgi:O-acetyl-ADP-ribose deacetylase (regulator of RNase III)